MWDNTAIIGAPNRDTYYSGVNGGAAYFFDLGFLNVRFDSREYEVLESDGKVTFNLQHCSPVCQVPPGPALFNNLSATQPLQYRTLDGNVFPVYTMTSSAIPPPSWQRSRAPAIGRQDCDVNSFGVVSGGVVVMQWVAWCGLVYPSFLPAALLCAFVLCSMTASGSAVTPASAIAVRMTSER